MHWPFLKFAYKCDSCQVKEAIDKTFPAKFCRSIFPCSVFNYFFADLSKSCPFCNYGDVSMHFTVHLDAFYNFFFVGFQSAVEVMQPDTACFAGGGIIYFRWKVFSQLIIKSLFLPAADQVISIFDNHSPQLSNLIW